MRRKWKLGLALVYVFVLVFSFVAAVRIAGANGDAPDCPCLFWCVTYEDYIPGDWWYDPLEQKFICTNHQTNWHCMCPL